MKLSIGLSLRPRVHNPETEAIVVWGDPRLWAKANLITLRTATNTAGLLSSQNSHRLGCPQSDEGVLNGGTTWPWPR